MCLQSNLSPVLFLPLLFFILSSSSPLLSFFLSPLRPESLFLLFLFFCTRETDCAVYTYTHKIPETVLGQRQSSWSNISFLIQYYFTFLSPFSLSLTLLPLPIILYLSQQSFRPSSLLLTFNSLFRPHILLLLRPLFRSTSSSEAVENSQRRRALSICSINGLPFTVLFKTSKHTHSSPLLCVSSFPSHYFLSISFLSFCFSLSLHFSLSSNMSTSFSVDRGRKKVPIENTRSFSMGKNLERSNKTTGRRS